MDFLLPRRAATKREMERARVSYLVGQVASEEDAVIRGETSAVNGPTPVSPNNPSSPTGVIDDECVQDSFSQFGECKLCPTGSTSSNLKFHQGSDKVLDRFCKLLCSHPSSEYDCEPVPVEEVLRDLCGLDHSRSIKTSPLDDGVETTPLESTTPDGSDSPQERAFLYSKKDVVHKGHYRPWFHSRFRKGISISRKDSLTDLTFLRREIIACSDDFSSGAPGSGEGPRNRIGTKPTRKRGRDSPPSNSGDDEEEEVSFWICCDSCEKWRKVNRRTCEQASAQKGKTFLCKMLRGISCLIPEESWEDEDEEEGQSQIKRKSSKQASPTKRTKRGAIPSSLTEMPPPRTSALAASGMPPLSRLTAVIQVLREVGKPLHYEALTKMALSSGLIRFTGSQGTAGESMKAFLNKIIREGKTNRVVNVGKGVYGLQEW